MRMSGVSLASLSLLTAVLVLSLAVPTASAAPTATTAPGTTSWAYGGSVGDTVSAVGLNGSYSAHYYFAWKVIITETNTSSTTFQLEAQRTMAAAFYAEGALSSGAAQANLTVTAWQIETGFANFTSTGTVTTIGPNSTSVPAVAMLDENAWGSGNITGILTATWTSLTGSHSGEIYSSVAAQANAQITFQPGLGLFPLQPYPGESWTSSSAYSATGQYTVAWHIYGTAPWGTSSATGGGTPVSVQTSGNATLYGVDYGTITFGGDTAAVIGIAVSGNGFNFDDHEGILLLPSVGDLYGGNISSTGATGMPGTATFGTDRIDVSLGSIHSGGIVAARSTYGSSSVFGNTPTSSSQGVSYAAGTTSPATIQGNPMPVSQAEQWCLVSCPASPNHNGALIVVVLVVAAVAVFAIVGLAMVTGRKVRPHPVNNTTYAQNPAAPGQQSYPGAPRQP